MIYRGPGFLAWFGSRPTPPPPSPVGKFFCLSLLVFLCISNRAYWRERGGVGEGPNYITAIKPVCKSLKTLCFALLFEKPSYTICFSVSVPPVRNHDNRRRLSDLSQGTVHNILHYKIQVRNYTLRRGNLFFSTFPNVKNNLFGNKRFKKIPIVSNFVDIYLCIIRTLCKDLGVSQIFFSLAK